MIRNIQTSYYFRKTLVKTNRAVHANSAVLCCVDHMQHDKYQANLAEVFDSENGELHAVITRSVTGNINIIFKREVRDDNPASVTLEEK